MSNINKVGNLITNDYELTNKLFKNSEVLSATKLDEAPYVERSNPKEGTYIIKLDKTQANTSLYNSFLEALEDGLMWRTHTVKTPTLEEFINRKYEDGRKIGKQLAKDNCPQYVIDYFSSIEILEEKEVCLTITGAPQFMIGVSAFSNNEWDSYSGSSCLDVTKSEGNQIHVLGLLTAPNFYVAFTHERPSQVTEVDVTPRIMETRVILFEDGNGDLHFNSKAYGSGKKDKVMIKKVLKDSGLCKGLVDTYIDEDYIDFDKDATNGLDSHTDSYLSDISNGEVKLGAKVYKDIFQPIEVGVRGAYDIELGLSKVLDSSNPNRVLASCPCCRPLAPNSEDGEVIKRHSVVADFHDYRTDDGGVLENVEIDLDANCPACGNERTVTIMRSERWSGGYYHYSNIPSTWGDAVGISRITDKYVSYEDQWYILDNLNMVKMLRTYGLYEEGTFHVNGKDFILIYDENQEVKKEEAVQQNNDMKFLF